MTDDVFSQVSKLVNSLGFDSLTPGPSDEQKEHLDKNAEQLYALVQDFNKTFTTPHGKRVLQHLREMTIESSTWRASLGLINGIANGFAREGQNALVRYIEDQVKAAVVRAEQLRKDAENERRTKAEAAGK